VSHPLLTAPIGLSLWRLAGPTTGLMVVQIFVAIAETWIIGRLGTDALAGFVLVVPFMVLMFNMANGGIGGGVASALARALGAGRQDDARALVVHAMVVALGFALLFMTLAWTALPLLFRLMGGSGRALDQALTYSSWWFAGAVIVWPNCLFAALLRGGGDTLTPSRIGLVLSIVYVALSTVLGLALGLGLGGLVIAGLAASAGSAVLQARAIRRGRLGFVPSFAGVRLQRRLFGEILRVGLVGSAATLTGSLTAMLMTGLVGHFGTAALAGYGIGVRLEYMLAPLAFGIGTGLTTLVGVAAGAHDWRRANRVAWIGGTIAFALFGLIGGMAALFPESWSRLFTSDAAVVAATVACLTRVAPFYCFLGLGLTLYFASQGAGRMALPFTASFSRLIVAAAGGWFAIERLGLGLDGVFAAIAAGLAVYGCLIAGGLLVKPWRARRGRALATPS
jgi:putative MATE family efflux protein